MMKSCVESGVCCYEFDSLQEFLYWKIQMYPRGGTQSPIQGNIYRGMSDESYELIPTAHRYAKSCKQPCIMKYHPVSSSASFFSRVTDKLVVSAELAGLKKFFSEANRQGCTVPHSFSISSLLFKEYNNKFMDEIKEWYVPDIVELAALAQHSGFPTRLLDWTYDINTALYFALCGVIKKLHSEDPKESQLEGKHYVVWCLNAKSLGLFSDHFSTNFPLEFFVPNYAENQNLRAQSGVLSYQKSVITNEDFVPQPINKVIQEYQNNIGGSDPLMYKLVFPVNEAVADFKYIRNNGYHAARLFPGFNGVMRKLEEDEWIKDLEGRGM